MRMSDHFRKDYGSADYRRVYNEQLDKLIAAEERRDELQRQWSAALKARKSLIALQGTDQFDREEYYHQRGRMTELEAAISKAKWHVALYREIWDALRPPTPRRPRKTVLIDGIRTKLEHA